MLTLQKPHVDEIVAHARITAPGECCGLLGGTENGQTATVYRLRNVAAEPLTTYEAAPEELFAAQRLMRSRGEELLAIYHSHPRSPEPSPSETDVALAYYPQAVYLIVGLGANQPCVRAFRVFERERRWEQVEYRVVTGD